MKQEFENTVGVIPMFNYLNHDSWQPLPTWSKSLIDLGAAIVNLPKESSRRIAAVALPTNAYAGVFTGLGAILNSISTSTDSEEYLQFIKSQSPGTSVIYQSKTRRLRGQIEKFSTRDGETYISIQIGKRERYQLKLRGNASKLTVVEKEFTLRNYQRGTKSPQVSKFLQELIHDPQVFTTQSFVHCIFVGNKNEIESQAHNITLRTEPSCIEGTPQEILRIESKLTNQPYRSKIVASSASIARENLPLDVKRPPIVIFQGSNGYLRHYSKWPCSHHLILLGRTESAFNDAVHNLNERYVRRLKQRVDKSIFHPPNSVEAMIFQEAII